MSEVVFAFPGNELLAQQITTAINAEVGVVTIRKFPDGESLVQVQSDAAGKHVIVVATLDQPDNKILPLYYLCKKLKADGAQAMTLVAPYLAYMRQDKSFHPGEVVTADYFASLLSTFVDRLITVDPHLHRHRSLTEIYSIPCTVLHSSNLIANWITDHVDNPVLIGPDSESKQWVSQVAAKINAPFIILEKQRLGDRDVNVAVPQAQQYESYTPVLVDDIISTARTMIVTIKHLQEIKLRPVVCIGVHALFAGDAYGQLLHSKAATIITCNTIAHFSNQIDITELIIHSLKNTP